jgi:hypothetical protein
MYTTRLKIQFYILPIECIYLYVLSGCPKKERLFQYITLISSFLEVGRAFTARYELNL